MEAYKSGGGMRGWADKQTDGDREAARCGLKNQREGWNKKTVASGCLYASALLAHFVCSYT